MSHLGHRVVTAAILLNLPVALLVEVSGSEVLERVDHCLLGFFAAELAVRSVQAVRLRRLSVWLVFDAFVIGLALLPWGVALPVLRTARVAHLARHAQHLLRRVTIARAAAVHA